MSDEQMITENDIRKAIEFLKTHAERAKQEHDPYATGFVWASLIMGVVAEQYIDLDRNIQLALDQDGWRHVHGIKRGRATRADVRDLLLAEFNVGRLAGAKERGAYIAPQVQALYVAEREKRLQALERALSELEKAE